MPNRLTQDEIDYEARNHLRVIVPLLERIGGGSAAQVSAGYVEEVDGEERFTDMGRSTVAAGRSVAWHSATYLHEEVLGHTTGLQHTRLLDDVQSFLAVTACALDGMDLKCAPPGVNPPWVAYRLLSMAEDLLKRAETEGVRS